MNEELLKKELEHIGLSDKEAGTYLAALELGKASIQDIAKKSGVKRATTYVATEFLMREGLMSSIQEGKKQYFMAENPERLGDFLDRRRAELEEKKKGIKRLVPELQQIHQSPDSSTIVRYYNGKQGVLSMVKNFLSVKEGETVWAAYPQDKVDKLFSDNELKNHKFVRSSKNIKVKSFYTTAGKDLPNSISTQRVRLDDKKYKLPADIAVYEDRVRLATLDEEVFGIVIKNKDIADSLKTILRLAWETAKKRN